VGQLDQRTEQIINDEGNWYMTQGGPTGNSSPAYCRTCGQQMDPGDRFCSSCGSAATVQDEPAQQPAYCPRCGAANPQGAVNCGRCGAGILGAAAQPNPAPAAARAMPTVPNYLVHAILATVCCCLPAGIVAIVFAAQVNTKLAAGDYAGAVDASNKAKTWSLVALGAGIAAFLLYAVMGLSLGTFAGF
jgi:uncharacterized membrane protein YvbJ